MRQDAQRANFSVTAAAATMRLFAPASEGDRRARPRFALLVLLCLLLHAALLAYLLIARDLQPPLAPPEEIPVEVIVEPPPPPPEQKQEESKPKEEQPPPPPPPPMEQQYEKPATDAPRAENKEKIERDAPDKETKAPATAPPKEEPEKLELKKEKQAPEDAHDDANKPDASAAPKSLEEKLDAETLENAEQTPKADDKQGRKQAKPEKNKGETRSIAEQVAALTPLPSYEFGSMAKPTPVSGGNAKATYLSILYGIIMPHMQAPARVRSLPAVGRGIVVFYIDEAGHLTHQAVARSSGAPELDMAAVNAIRSAAPFPAPPRGHPHALQFTYSPK